MKYIAIATLFIGCGDTKVIHTCTLPSGEEISTESIEACNQVAVPGEQGPQGMAGKNGVNGKDGAPGEDGIDGIDGVPGKDGVDGLNGNDGKEGNPGKDGVNGVDGIQGPKGDTPIMVKNIITLSATKATSGLYSSPTPLILLAPSNISVPGASSTSQGWISLRVDSTYLCYQRRNNPTNSPVYEFKWSKDTPCDVVPYEGETSTPYLVEGNELELILHSPQISSTTVKQLQLSTFTFE